MPTVSPPASPRRPPPSRSAPTTRWVRRQLVQQIKRVPALHRAAKELWVGAKLVRLRLRQARRRREGLGDARWQQSTRRFATRVRADHADPLRAELRAHGLEVREGRHTLYVAPAPALAEVLGPLVNAYPPGCGFKILKRFAAPERARYLYETDAGAEAALLGDIYEQALAAAALAYYDLGPRLYDVVHLRAGSVDLTVLVVEHVDGRLPTADDHRRLLDALDALRQSPRMMMANPGVYACTDFEAPLCNGNLLVDDDRLRYVDPQLFLFDVDAVLDDVLGRHRDVLHFGDRLGVVRGGQRFLYQGLPGRDEVGRRDPEARWRRLDALLRPHGGVRPDRVVFDVCCNAGLMMAGALRRGARWAVGWDLPAVAAAADDLLPLLGAGRSTVIGRPIDDDARLVDDVPPWLGADDGLCLFLAAWHHVGFPPGVGALPWRHLVYEGREHEDAATTAANIARMERRWGARAIATRADADGLCGSRPLVLLERPHPGG